MGEAFLDLLKTFGFKEMKEWIAIGCSLVFLANLLGGMMSGFITVSSKQLVERKLTDRISFRLFIITEVCLVMFALYYHTFMIEEVTVVHTIYWVSAAMMAPLLAIIGSQMMLIIFSGKMKALKKEAKRLAKAQRTQRHATMEVDHSKLPTPPRPRR